MKRILTYGDKVLILLGLTVVIYTADCCVDHSYADNKVINKLEGEIKNCSKEQQDIAKNVANLNNPRYVPKTTDKELLDAAGHPDRKVMIEQEMTKMSRNTLRYNAYIRLLTSKFQTMKKVASLGK